jgi:hypothetical protein
VVPRSTGRILQQRHLQTSGAMGQMTERYLEYCLYFDFPVSLLLWLKKIMAKIF